ncbi:hypothetical protein HF086_002846 [Spodoptera exigua]|uniref:Uncharacterized protein n=1 Tax=Spodoptera exigua TaxID=7107 RepID=A0A922SIR5_SPOEX|nr:hypothetical protein HF086_002846 [Spodoptera exigua]
MTRASTSPPLRLLERFANSTPAPTTTTTSTNVAPSVPKPSANNKRPTPIIIYPTVTEILLQVFNTKDIFRERARRRNCELDRGELSVVKMSPVKTKPRPVSLIRSPRPPPTLELDTVLEERSDPEQTTLSQVEVTPDREVGTILFGAVGAMGTAAAAAMCNRDS